MDWNEGYRTDITYTYGYYGEMNPACMRFLMLMAGVTPPDVASACELGYGQGLSLNIHAASENIAWTGTDFNPVQAAFAQEMARVSGARANCYAESFHDFCNRDDLPEFDYIALHGIWSWISPENQTNIVKLVDRKLRIGGALYISYNTFPGWAAFRPARDLMKLYAERQDALGLPILKRIADSFAFMERLGAVKPAYLVENQSVGKRLELFKDKDASYLAHEFFNDDWNAVNFAEMASALASARMTFACSAEPIRAIPGIGLNEEQRHVVDEITDPVLKETVSDFIRNTQFRKDYWLKGARPMQTHTRLAQLRNELFILTASPESINQEIKIGNGTVNLSAASRAILSSVLHDGKVHYIAELEKAAHDMAAREDKPEGIERENIFTLAQALCVLMAASIAAPAQKKQDALKAKPTADRLNAFLENRAVPSNEISFLASPVTGGGVACGRFDMIFLLAIRNGAKTPGQMAAYARDCLHQVGQKIIQDGEPIEDQEKALEHLAKLAESFTGTRLPVLKNLMIA